jgi:hypothetical protein
MRRFTRNPVCGTTLNHNILRRLGAIPHVVVSVLPLVTKSLTRRPPGERETMAANPYLNPYRPRRSSTMRATPHDKPSDVTPSFTLAKPLCGTTQLRLSARAGLAIRLILSTADGTRVPNSYEPFPRCRNLNPCLDPYRSCVLCLMCLSGVLREHG